VVEIVCSIRPSLTLTLTRGTLRALFGSSVRFGVPFYAMDIGVGINVGIAGFTSQLVSGVLGNMDFNALSIVGVSSMEELHGKIATKADALYVKSGIFKKADGEGCETTELVRAILDACSGDD